LKGSRSEAGGAGSSGRPPLPGWLDVPRETLERLDRYVELLRKWQRAHNLVAPGTLDRVWERHIFDSAQLVALFPNALRWMDLGSGAGLPGLVIAILLTGRPNAHVQLVESDLSKSAFLRAAIRDTGAPAEVHSVRIESLLSQKQGPIDVVTARALAPLERLVPMVEKLIAAGARAAFLKGRDLDAELAALDRAGWEIKFDSHPSRSAPDGRIIEIREARRRPR
jgi:16S rRNA (guanine527-N7)-methyltransferase